MLKIEFSVLSPSPISSFSRDWQKSHVTDQSQTGKKNQLKSSSFFATLQRTFCQMQEKNPFRKFLFKF